ncbi:OTU-like cysteine [Mycena kentingensis (nom. inval.)]|nr:OTU-like cysteine [Mycena kentingensis (nom. inval.)]
MPAIRLRHPKGTSTLQIPLDSDTYTVQDLQNEIQTASGILPSRQSLKSGYPPQVLTALIPELPVSSLGLKAGEQLLVSETADDSGISRAGSRPPPASATPSPARSGSGSAAAGSPFLNPVASSARTEPVSPIRAGASSSSSEPDAVETDGSFLVHRVVPDDNSCLFSSVALIFEQDLKKASKIRQIVADGIRKDPETFNEAILGLPPSSYISKILQPATWGGAIELGILAAHYGAEICSIDVETGRIDHFTPDAEKNGTPDNRCILIYSGIHYDAATLAPMRDAPADWHQTLFPTRNSDILEAGKRLADILRGKRKFTNTATFDLKCEQCGVGLKGEKGAQAHAKETGHTSFGEY